MSYDFRASADRTILRCLHPKSKTLTKEQKERLKAILISKGNKVWERNRARLREQREARRTGVIENDN